MVVIVCIDDAGGMMFNGRRQSRDKVLQQEILKMTEGKKLYMNEYSYNSFEDFLENHIEVKTNIVVDNEFIGKVETGEYCFIENKGLYQLQDKIEKMIIFKWNKTYPADFFLDMSLESLKLAESVTFKGNSHEKITMEVYVK